MIHSNLPKTNNNDLRSQTWKLLREMEKNYEIYSFMNLDRNESWGKEEVLWIEGDLPKDFQIDYAISIEVNGPRNNVNSYIVGMKSHNCNGFAKVPLTWFKNSEVFTKMIVTLPVNESTNPEVVNSMINCWSQWIFGVKLGKRLDQCIIGQRDELSGLAPNLLEKTHIFNYQNFVGLIAPKEIEKCIAKFSSYKKLYYCKIEDFLPLCEEEQRQTVVDSKPEIRKESINFFLSKNSVSSSSAAKKKLKKERNKEADSLDNYLIKATRDLVPSFKIRRENIRNIKKSKNIIEQVKIVNKFLKPFKLELEFNEMKISSNLQKVLKRKEKYIIIFNDIWVLNNHHAVAMNGKKQLGLEDGMFKRFLENKKKIFYNIIRLTNY